MADHETRRASTTEGLPVAPSLSPTLERSDAPRLAAAVDRRVLAITGVACGVAVAAALVAELLGKLIAGMTNLAFYGRLSLASVSPALAVITHFFPQASFKKFSRFSFELSSEIVGAPVKSLMACSGVPDSMQKYDPYALA